jgi:hypothetical protein
MGHERSKMTKNTKKSRKSSKSDENKQKTVKNTKYDNIWFEIDAWKDKIKKKALNMEFDYNGECSVYLKMKRNPSQMGTPAFVRQFKHTIVIEIIHTEYAVSKKDNEECEEE